MCECALALARFCRHELACMNGAKHMQILTLNINYVFVFEYTLLLLLYGVFLP